jgi:hypothetical protein
VRTEALALIKANYADFGPTLAAEKLAERHKLQLGVETVRRWMLAEGLWKDRRQRLKPVHQPRRRRDCVGELVQIEGSEHWWFEDRGPQCTLLVFIDDATSRLMHLRFVESESTFDYFLAATAYLQRYGKPVAFYSDKHANVSRQQEGRGRRRRHDAIRTSAARSQHRHYLREHEPGQGPSGASEFDAAG